MHTLNENYRNDQALAPQSVTALTNGAGVDLGPNLRDDVMVAANLGAVTGTTPTLDIAVQTSPDNSTWTEVATFAQLTDANADSVVSIAVRLEGQNSDDNEQRFARAVLTTGGTTPDFLVGLTFTTRSEDASASLNQG